MNTSSEKEYIKKYDKKGFDKQFKIAENRLEELESSDTFSPKEVYIKAEHRFEGISNPSDMSILYAIETKNKQKGTVLANYGPANDTAMAEFFNSIPKENVSQEHNILKE